MWMEKRVLRTKSSWRKGKEIRAKEEVREGIRGCRAWKIKIPLDNDFCEDK